MTLKQKVELMHKPWYPVGRVEPLPDTSDVPILVTGYNEAMLTKNPQHPDSIIAVRVSGGWPPNECIKVRKKQRPPEVKIMKGGVHGKAARFQRVPVFGFFVAIW